MDLVSVIIFLVLYYIRPQEWIGFVNALQPVKASVAFALVAMFFRHRGITWKDIFKTPHDWAMLAYFLWIVLSAPVPGDALKDVYNLFVFYLITVQALSTIRRIQIYLNWWTVMILMVAGLAVASEFGFDLMGSSDITHGMMRDRLVLNLSIFNNPNALGHGIVPVVVMLYFTLFWKRPIFSKIFSLPIFLLPLYCIYLTVSKGAFISGFATATLSMIFGRPKLVQIAILGATLTFGLTAVRTLPRMNEIDKAKSDEAIQGRVAAFKWGLYNFKTRLRGVGYHQFNESFIRAHKYFKAAHSSFNQIGCELGRPGMYLFLAMIYYAMRTLYFANCRNVEEERVRRILYVLIISHLVSSWMVDFGFRTSLFLFLAAIAAFHRALLEKESDATPTEVTPLRPIRTLNPSPAAVTNLPTAAAGNIASKDTPPVTTIDITPAGSTPGIKWNRIRWYDFIFIGLMLYATQKLWEYAIKTM
jgi:hypothetical protein